VPIINTLKGYASRVSDQQEHDHICKTIDFISRVPQAFERDHEAGGHVGASAVVISQDSRHILLTRHTVLGTLSFFGNHCDGETDLASVALKRIIKDAGNSVAQQCELQPGIFDVDIHPVPMHKKGEALVPAHLHYDIAFLFKAKNMMDVENESSRWFTMDSAFKNFFQDSQGLRILKKLTGTS
jgi:hypothetical protein